MSRRKRAARIFAWREPLLDALRLSPQISRACKAAGISRNSVYAHLRRDPGFRRRWERALNRGFKVRYREHEMRLRSDPAFQRSLLRYPAFAEWWQGRTDITD